LVLHSFPTRRSSDLEAVSVEPRIAAPAIEGRPVFDGTVAMSAVAADVALAVPTALVAVTRTRSVPPPSAACSTYVTAVAPAMSRSEEHTSELQSRGH